VLRGREDPADLLRTDMAEAAAGVEWLERKQGNVVRLVLQP
jgi:hypothetical protein